MTERGEVLAGFRPRTAFCFGKRTQNHSWPFGCLCPGPERFGLRNSLRSNSPRPPTRFRDRGAATPAGALRWRHLMARVGMPRPSPLLTKEGNIKTLDPLLEGLLMSRMTERGGGNAGFRPRTPRSCCFGKRTQNHGRPGVALRVPLPRSRKVWAAELASLKQSSPPTRVRDWGAATPAGALRWRHGMARV